MLSWASSKLEQLSQTVAPPPTDATSRFVYSVQRNDEAGAMACLAEMDPLHTIVQPTKGTLPLHLACHHGMVRLIRQLMAIPGASIETLDGYNNTPLHHASMMSTDGENAIHVVKMLVTEYNASVVAKNSQGQTPYDVASLNSIRQYLLPLQLQRETQQAIDNGGVGLPPGIDMGGLRIRNPVMPPPPPLGGGAGGPPPPGGGAGGPSPPASSPAYPPPSQNVLATPSPTMPAAPSTFPTHNAPAAVGGGPSSAPSSGNDTTPAYARTGSSSAAILSKSKFRPDGFHSSSSDVGLQKKYGHSSHSTTRPAVPPPPSSGNSSASGGGTNPYAAGMSAFGSARPRYPVYDAVTGQVSAPNSSSSATTTPSMPTPPPPPAYTMFQPAATAAAQPPAAAYPQQQTAYQQPTQQNQQAAYQQPSTYQQHAPYQPAYPQPTQQDAAYQQPAQQTQQQQPAYQQPATLPNQSVPYQQPNVYQQQTGQVNSSNKVQAAPAVPAPYPVAQTISSVSAASAEELFGSPSPSDTMRKKKDDKAASSSITETSAQELFAGEDSAVQAPNATDGASTEQVAAAAAAGEPSAAESVPAKQPDPVEAAQPTATSNGGNAAEFFGSSTAEVAEKVPEKADETNGGEQVAEKAQELNQKGVTRSESSEALDEVPLEEVSLSSPAATNNPSNGPAALTASIGLPPPPFSSRQ